MSDKTKLTIIFLIFLSVAVLSFLFLFTNDIAVLNPKGMIATKQRSLLVISTFLMLLVVLPVFVMTFVIAWRYRASNKKARYEPNWDYSLLAESVWWGVPCLIIVALGIVNWKACHELDPFRPIAAKEKQMTIQVIALDWKWLFLYPEQKIATVNYVQFPEQTPIHFEITADAPMNSFWIPQLGGQIYAMAGMRSELHLIADEPGSYRGSSANISGEGFSGMTFTAKATSQEEFDRWVELARGSKSVLSVAAYHELAEPSEYNPVEVYRWDEEDLFDQIMMQYMEMGSDASK